MATGSSIAYGSTWELRVRSFERVLRPKGTSVRPHADIIADDHGTGTGEESIIGLTKVAKPHAVQRPPPQIYETFITR